MKQIKCPTCRSTIIKWFNVAYCTGCDKVYTEFEFDVLWLEQSHPNPKALKQAEQKPAREWHPYDR